VLRDTILKHSEQTRSTSQAKFRAQFLRAPNGGLSVAAVAAVLAVAVAGVYCWFLTAPFIFDDEYSIEQNESIRSLWPLIGAPDHPGPLNPAPQLPTAARPLVNLTFALNYHLFGLNAAWFHAVNVLIHFLSTMLVWALLHRMLRLPYFAGRYEISADWLALAIAILWALHPLQTESVIYATQRTELMFAFFYLATLYCSLRYWFALPLPFREGLGEGSSQPHRQRATWLMLAVFACLAGMASKEVMVSAPLMVLLFERTFIAGSLANALRKSWPLYLGLFATWILLFSLVLGGSRSESAGFNLNVPAYAWWLTQAKALLIYLKLVFLPWPLLIHYQLPYFYSFLEAWPYVVPVLLLAVAILVLLWRNHPLGYLGTWVFAILSPTLVIPIITEIVAERRMYLPLLAFVVLAVLAGHRLIEQIIVRRDDTPDSSRIPYASRAVAFVPTIALATLFGLLSAIRLGAYQDEVRLWRDVVQFFPEDKVAHFNMGSALMRRNDKTMLLSAIDSFQAGLALDPNDLDVLNNLGLTLLRLNRYQESISVLQRAAKLHPKSAAAHLNLGLAFSRAGRREDAINQLRLGLAITPNHADALAQLGLDLILTGRNQEAIQVLNRAVDLRPDSVEIHDQLGSALAHTGKISLAIEQFRKAQQLDNNDLNAHYNLALLLADSGDADGATSHFEQALRIKPDFAETHNTYADFLRKRGRIPQAIERYQAAIQANPAFLQAYINLAQTLAQAGRSAEAFTIGEQAIRAARSANQEAAAVQLEAWLNHLRTELGRPADPTPASTSNP
jgi:protein O-mannosyl-transferase